MCIFSLVTKAWLPLNVSVLTTNRSCLLVLTLLHFAGFHRQLSPGLLRGLLCLEVCKSCSASGIEFRNNDFPKVVVKVLKLCSLFSEDRKYYFLYYIIGSHRSQSLHIAAKASQKFNMCDIVASTLDFIT